MMSMIGDDDDDDDQRQSKCKGKGNVAVLFLNDHHAMKAYGRVEV
jgi:hypothetical protein